MQQKWMYFIQFCLWAQGKVRESNTLSQWSDWAASHRVDSYSYLDHFSSLSLSSNDFHMFMGPNSSI